MGPRIQTPLILPMDPLRLVDSNSKTSIIVIDNDKKKERKKKNALELCQESCAGQYSGMNWLFIKQVLFASWSFKTQYHLGTYHATIKFKR